MKAVTRIGILGYPGAQQAAVLGLLDLLEVADRLHREQAPGAPGLETQILSAEQEVPEPPHPSLHALILPPNLGQVQRLETRALLEWIRDRHQEGTLLCSVCAGAALLAEAGLLAGRAATTHWGLGPAFAERYPEVHWDTDRLLIDEGDLVTAGGLMAWVDLGLNLVHRYLGPTTLLAVARHFLVDPGGREQRFYTTFAPSLAHGDPAVLKVQQWLARLTELRPTVPQMAARAKLGERTFLRRFQQATGLGPTEYLQHLRVSRARALLEQSDLGLEEIAWRVGYENPGAFRKVFVRLMGLTPGEYRRRFRIGTQMIRR